jgi:hypothetical protein
MHFTLPHFYFTRPLHMFRFTQKPSSGGSQNYIYLHPMVFLSLLLCNILVFKKKYLMQINPQPPTLNAQIKIHKENEPIGPVIVTFTHHHIRLQNFLTNGSPINSNSQILTSHTIQHN